MASPPRLGTLVRTEPVTPLFRRLVFGGPDMAAFDTRPGVLGPYLKFRLAGPDGRTCVRTYSVRRFDPARGELQVDVLLHAGDSPGSSFAATARTGDTLELGGPGFIPAAPAPAYLLAGDLSALPAIAHILDTLPAGPAVTAIVEVPDRSEEQPIPGISWLLRPPGAPSRLPDCVRDAWPAGDILLFAGAEASIARTIRRHARRERGLPDARCQVLNYWKTGRAEGAFSYVG